VGEYGNASHFNGAVWQAVDTGVEVDLYEVWGAAPNDLWATGDQGTILRHTGLGWTEVENPTRGRVTALFGRSPTDITVAGDFGEIHHYDGTNWLRQVSGVESALNTEWFLALGGGQKRSFAVGAAGLILSRLER
jgi:hypothetical protein